MMLQLGNVYSINSDTPICIQVQKGRISALPVQPTDDKKSVTIHFDDALAFPGLINSHDHLDFNLFPALGGKVYDSYRQWGHDIHSRYKAIIDAVQQIPEALRAQWGVYKNLCSGVTTVVNHGKKIKLPKGLPIQVFQDCYCLHSVGFENDWQSALQRPFRGGKPFVIHCGEGTDKVSRQEIDELIQANRLNRSLMGVHGVAMTKEQATHFTALVWCPASNYFLLGKTAAVDQLQQHTNILFGTDSTLTASWNIWEHLRLARQQQLLSDDELLAGVSSSAAAVWKLPASGSLAEGQVANLVITKAQGQKGMDAFFATNPQDILLVLYQGNISLFDENLLDGLQRQGVDIAGYESVTIGQSVKYVKGPVQQLMQQVRQYYPEAQFFPDKFLTT